MASDVPDGLGERETVILLRLVDGRVLDRRELRGHPGAWRVLCAAMSGVARRVVYGPVRRG